MPLKIEVLTLAERSSIDEQKYNSIEIDGEQAGKIQEEETSGIFYKRGQCITN